MTSYSDTVIRLATDTFAHHRVEGRVHAGGFNASSFDKATRIPDIAGVIADFEKLEVRADLVANAIAAFALDDMRIAHSISSGGLTISIRTPKNTVLPSLSKYRPMDMLRCK